MRILVRCTVIAVAGFSLGVGMIHTTWFVIGGVTGVSWAVTLFDLWKAAAIPFVIAGVLCGSGAFFVGSRRSELVVGAVAGGAGLYWVWSHFYPWPHKFAFCLIMGTVVFELAELGGFKLAARIQRRGAATDG